MIPSEIKEDALGETKESLGIQNQHFCKECNISFNKGKSLETHADYSHKDVRWEICQVTVGSKYNLIRHKEVHQQNKVKCEHCDLILSRKSLKRHKQVMHELIKLKKTRRGPYKNNVEYSKSQIKTIASQSNFDNVCFVVSFCIIYTLNVSTSSFFKLNIIYTWLILCACELTPGCFWHLP